MLYLLCHPPSSAVCCVLYPPPSAIMDSPQCQTAVTWLPVTPIPHVFDPSKRLQDLKDGLNPESSFYYFYTG